MTVPYLFWFMLTLSNNIPKVWWNLCENFYLKSHFQVLPGTTDGISWMLDVSNLEEMCCVLSKSERKSGVKMRSDFRDTVFGQQLLGSSSQCWCVLKQDGSSFKDQLWNEVLHKHWSWWETKQSQFWFIMLGRIFLTCPFLLKYLFFARKLQLPEEN